MKKLILVALCLMMVPALGLAQDNQLSLKQGTMTLGGTAAFTFMDAIPDQGDSQTGWLLTISPSAGYFLIDNLMLEGAVGLTMYGGDMFDAIQNKTKTISFDVGARYFIPMGSLAFYAGAKLGMAFNIPEEGDTTKALAISVPAGVLWALNSHVAIDLGLRFTYNMSLEDGGSDAIVMPIGYFGLQAFF